MKLLILRPRPGADESAGRAVAKGLEPVVAPLFTIWPLDWEAPDADGIEAVLMTSANGARHAGEQVRAFTTLPCYAVGEASAEAARAAGFRDVRPGRSDGAATIARMAADGIARALHLCGRDHIEVAHPQVALIRRLVYAAEAVDALPPPALQAIEDGAVAMLHSPRAGRLFASLADEAGLERERIRLAAISEAAAEAAGSGWKNMVIAAAPSDHALLEVAAQLCQTGAEEMGRAD